MIPSWLHLLSIVALLLGLACAAFIAVDEVRHPQHMWIMNVVWPVTALFGTLAVLWCYLRYGRLSTHAKMMATRESDATPPSKEETPFPIMVAKGALHCGSGCTLGDVLAETLAALVPAVAIVFGYGWLFGEEMFAVWVLDFVFAFLLGIAFQYFTIKPMRGLSPREGLRQAIKADTLSLISWQVGMYGFMAVAQFWLFRTLIGEPLEVSTPEFWFMMQIAMVCGFVTAYPVNWWLIVRGTKEAM